MTGWQSTYKIRLQESNDWGDEMNDIVSANSNNIFLELSNNMIPLRRLLFNPRSGERFLSTHCPLLDIHHLGFVVNISS